MKQPNPLVPQGSFEAQARGKSQVRLAVFTILTIHVVILGALLIHGAGCKREDKEASNAATNDLSSTPPFATSNDVVTPVTPPVTPAPTGTAPATPGPFTPTGGVGTTTPPSNPLPVPAPSPITPPPTPAPLVENGGGASEHTIVRGDTFSGLATKYGTSIKAIQAANPGVDPTKLRPGLKIKIPTRTNGGATGAAAATPGADSGDFYVVKAKDTLSSIATAKSTTVKAIQKLNNLKTTSIRVGQKLKLPPPTLPASRATASPARSGGTPPGGETAPPVVPPPLPAQ